VYASSGLKQIPFQKTAAFERQESGESLSCESNYKTILPQDLQILTLFSSFVSKNPSKYSFPKYSM
jgi:hypothetical protein